MKNIHSRTADEGSHEFIQRPVIYHAQGANLFNKTIIHDDDPVSQCHCLNSIMRHID